MEAKILSNDEKKQMFLNAVKEIEADIEILKDIAIKNNPEIKEEVNRLVKTILSNVKVLKSFRDFE
ncbi:hypothetical protein [Geobacillus sp. B4113_201601]|uniref:hypothetical protein n=1 Tax=Geobacillus sp. B4113_201601 TaxID=1586290 RepID=UPI0007814ECF|nr:hypothetical protein [Geobacillus sp. B4113_201601]KYD29927.1 hypothetical protein B4113_1161 [Geobacillus sp. B4113_201601]